MVFYLLCQGGELFDTVNEKNSKKVSFHMLKLTLERRCHLNNFKIATINAIFDIGKE